MNEYAFQNSGAYYDLLYQDKDYEAEAAYVANRLRHFRKNAQGLLEFGSGTGRYGRLLAAHGFHVLGVERSDAMLSIARDASGHSASVAGSCEYLKGDIRTVDVGRVFDCVVSLFHVVSYQTRNSDVVQTFANAGRHLGPQGLFLFDVWHGPAVLRQWPSVRVKRVEDSRTRLIRMAEPEVDTQKSLVKVRYTIFAESGKDGQFTTFNEEHCMRYFFPTEIELLASQTGFEIEKCEEFLSGQLPSESSWGVTYVLRKRA